MRLSFRIPDLSPFGPIFGKELRVSSRRKRNHVLRVAYLGGLLLFLLMVWSENSYSYQAGVAARVQAQNTLGQYFFLTFSLFCVFAMGLIGPVLTCTAINSERLGKTLPVLLMTPITSWQIVSGKLLSRLLTALMLIGLSLPVLAVVRLLGGVELHQMIAVVGMCTVFAMSSAAIGLFYSTLVNRAYAVILLSYATQGLLFAFLPIMWIMLVHGTRGPGRGFELLQALNPVFNVMLYSIPERTPIKPAWYLAATIHLSVTGILLACSAMILRWHARKEPERGGAGLDLPPPLAPMLTTENGKTDELTQSLLNVVVDREPEHVSDNPVLWRELRRPLLPRRWRLLVAALMVALLLLSYAGFAAIRALHDSDLQVGYADVFHGLYWLLVAVLSATAIAQEKESDTWTVLMASPLSARAIVLGKVLGVARRLFWPTVFIAGHFTVFCIADLVSWQVLLMILWTLVTFNSVWLALGVFLSLRLKKVTTAVITNLIVPVALFGGVPLVLAILGEAFGGNGETLAELTCWYLPYFYLTEMVDRLCPVYDPTKQLWLPSYGWGMPAELLMTWLLRVGVIHLAVAAFIVGATISRFDRLVGRAPQRRPFIGGASSA